MTVTTAGVAENVLPDSPLLYPNPGNGDIPNGRELPTHQHRHAFRANRFGAGFRKVRPFVYLCRADYMWYTPKRVSRNTHPKIDNHRVKKYRNRSSRSSFVGTQLQFLSAQKIAGPPRMAATVETGHGQGDSRYGLV